MGLDREVAGEHSAELIKPAIDKLQYENLTLDNGLQVMLVHDSTADKAAAAMDVRIGSMSDPDDIPGLAHFTEHMLFYASEKYPEEDAYSKYMSEHGGSTNAYTAAESTNYHFDVSWDCLDEALDRFAQFFICPLISQDGVEREANAVDSEHGKNINTDAWRMNQLWKATSNPSHPYARFSTGNLDTLLHKPKAAGMAVHERVREFTAAHYSANVMKLVVVGRHSIPELREMVRGKFQTVKDAGIKPPAFAADVVVEEQLGKLLRVVPERDGHVVELEWAVPPELEHYRASPCGYLSHLLGDEGEGSAFALLKARGWATSLMAGEGGGSFSSRSFFFVRMDLTDEGHKQLPEVLAVVFAYLRILNSPEGVTLERFEEMRQLNELRFNFAEKQQPFSYARSLASLLQVYPARDVLLGMYHVPQEFDPAAIRAVLAELQPATTRIMWASKLFKGHTKEVEPWYGTEYSQETLPAEWVEQWTAADPVALGLHLPDPNPFIPTEFGMIKAEAEAPEVIGEAPLWRLWHRPNPSFEAPKAIVYMSFVCPEAYTTPENSVLTNLFTKLLGDYLNELAYPAQLAGLAYSVSNTVQGFMLYARGYSHKLSELVGAVLQRVASFEVQADRFEFQRETAAKDYANYRFQQPYQCAMHAASVLLEARRWHMDEYAAVIGGLTAADLQAFFKRLVSRSFVELFVTGNVERAGALALARQVEDVLKGQLGTQPLFPSQKPERRVAKLQAGRPALLPMPGPNPTNENSAIVITYQIGPDEIRTNALGELLVHCCKREAFYQLRTVEQLGYMTHLLGWWHLHVQEIVVIIQSNAHTAAHLERRVQAFVAGFRKQLEEMSEEKFQLQVEELAKAKLEKPKTLWQQASREWGEIDRATLRFQRKEEEVAALRSLNQPELLSFFEEVMLDPRRRRQLSVHVLGAAEAAKKEEKDSNETQQEGPAVEPAAAGASGAAAVEPVSPAERCDDEPEAPAVAGGAGGACGIAETCREDEGTVGAPEVTVISDMWAFKHSQELYPAHSCA